MSRTKLVEALESLAPPTPAACLVLLWTYYEPQLSEVENALHEVHVQRLRLMPPYRRFNRANIAACLERLRALVGQNEDFDKLALALVKGLDRTLHDLWPQKKTCIQLTGFDGKRYQLRPRNNFIADTYDAPNHTLLIPAQAADTAPEFRVESRANWGDRHLQSRIRLARDAFRIMMWPLSIHIDYPDLDKLRGSPPPPFVSLRDPRNEDALKQAVEEALREAREQKVTILILPELAITPGIKDRISELLQGHGDDGYPLLALLGLCHALIPGKQSDVNEAVLLGPSGTVLHRHRKLAPFTQGGDFPCGERIETGSVITILESDIGNLTALICLDLFHVGARRIIERSHANLLLVPSLSQTTSAHRHAAADFVASQLAGTFVSNRPLVRPQAMHAQSEGTSFYRVPGNGEICHLPDQAGLPYLLFEL
jgi:Carbon-nitrogen hydrolase